MPRRTVASLIVVMLVAGLAILVNNLTTYHPLVPGGTKQCPYGYMANNAGNGVIYCFDQNGGHYVAPSK